MLRLSTPSIDESVIEAVNAVLRSGQLIYGAQGQHFEAILQDFLGVRHAIVVSSGTAALHLALVALGIGPGDAVLIPNFTFPATGNVVRLVGAHPVLVDVDPSTYCVTPDSVAAAIDAWRGPELLRAFIPVHEFGHPADMRALLPLARYHGLKVVEDAACAIGATENGKACGTQGDIGCWSLHPRKTLTTGEGGILSTDDDVLAAKLRLLRNHGIVRQPQGVRFEEPGYNLRLTDIQSAMGVVQLPHLPRWIDQRRVLAANYCQALAPMVSAGIMTLPAKHPGHSWQTFMVVLRADIDRDRLIRDLAGEGIETNIGAQCLSMQPAFENIQPLPTGVHASNLYKHGLALPFCESYGSPEVERVTNLLSRLLLHPNNH
ncbi:dTDP-4-amino-4,6-dideoxygalactose transaminase [Acidovorax sp. 107]|uniref:DegT/DnrJ/EryC1/StrS family aminotransferase n=1 Tax=Acidovorax sp. 107 TaxID=2135638 RepID=UPI000D3A8E29|nr:DegT/DnrJ/EryC1/StrS aminotransferase family protein [Acidovorax sp. 107]PUA99490.1 dTDP-4-amino-4,6-dideoxygalactose transaminase [Acidovorax sp. 107]